MVNRDEFALRQAQMTATWFENVRKTHDDVDLYIASRHQAYLRRWLEAGRFLNDGDCILDIGGGNLFPLLVAYLKTRVLDYHYVDIDPVAVQSTKSLLAENGFAPDQANQGFNDRFLYPDGKFDAIFSSHCLEHSIALPQTFLEANRLLKTGGHLLMAVPLGWEKDEEHPYFFDPDQWIALVEDAGFQIRVSQIGRDYPETGADLFIAAKKVAGANVTPRIEASAFTKKEFDFTSFASAEVTYFGDCNLADGGNAQHLRGNDWKVILQLPANVREVLPVMLRHDWSGIMQVSCEYGSYTTSDLYSWFSYIGVSRITAPSSKAFHWIDISCTGKNDASRASEGVFYGYMWR